MVSTKTPMVRSRLADGQPKLLPTHQPVEGEPLLLIRHWRNGIGWVISYRAALCIALFTVLYARTAPPGFPHITSSPTTVHCDGHHDQRPCFDHDGLYWCVAIEAFPTALPVALSPLLPTSEQVVLSHINGSHYTRPPPLS